MPPNAKAQEVKVITKRDLAKVVQQIKAQQEQTLDAMGRHWANKLRELEQRMGMGRREGPNPVGPDRACPDDGQLRCGPAPRDPHGPAPLDPTSDHDDDFVVVTIKGKRRRLR